MKSGSSYSFGKQVCVETVHCRNGEATEIVCYSSGWTKRAFACRPGLVYGSVFASGSCASDFGRESPECVQGACQMSAVTEVFAVLCMLGMMAECF